MFLCENQWINKAFSVCICVFVSSTGIVSKSFECRLKGQGASFVEADAAFAPDDPSSSAAATLCRIGTSGLEGVGSEAVQQVIIIQGYDGSAGGSVAVEQALEESAAATLQTLAMGGQVAEVLHITEDGQLITSSGRPATGAAAAAAAHLQLPHGTTQYVLVESGGGGVEAATAAILEGQGATVVGGGGASVAEVGHVMVSESSASSALDALLCAVSELGQQGGASAGSGDSEVVTTTTDSDGEIITTTVRGEEEEPREEAEDEGEVQVYREVLVGDEGPEPVGVVTQVVSHAPSDTPHDEMVQEVLQFAASQLMMKEGLTQVIVNDEGTHYIVTELDNSTLQLEGAVYAQSAEAGPGEAAQLEAQGEDGERVVVYTEEAAHCEQQEG